MFQLFPDPNLGRRAQLFDALGAQWYATPEFTRMMRDALEKLTVDDINKANASTLRLPTCLWA